MFRRTSDRPRRSLMRTIGVLTTLLMLIVVPVLTVGFWKGWFAVSSGSREGQWQLEFTIDTQEIKHDIGTAADQRDEWTERARQQGKSPTAPDAK